MDRMRKKVKALKETSFRKLHQEDLEGYGLQGIVLRQYQLDGVAWMNQCCQRGHGCVLGDEMGLGKTIQVKPRGTCMKPQHTSKKRKISLI